MLTTHQTLLQTQITIAEKRLFDRPLLQALFWSLLAHLVILGTVRIKMFDLSESVPTHPVALCIEADEVPIHVDRDPQQAILRSNEEWDSKCFEHTRRGILHRALSTQGLDFSIQAYPLQIKLSRSLKSCKLIRDGSELFSKKKTKDFLPHSTPEFTIEYSIEIDASGKIAKVTRQHELLDKQLQKVADRIVNAVRFWIPKKKTYTGTLTCTFYCTGDEIEGLLAHD